MPAYKPLMPYFDGGEGPAGEIQHPEVNPAKGDALLTAKGYKKDSGGFWADANGEHLKIDIIGFGASGAAMGPVLSEMLKRRGIEASFALPPDFDDRFQQGKFTGAIYGHGGSINEPYDTLRLYQGASIAVPGGHQANFARWKNAEYDKIVDEMFMTDPTNVPKLRSSGGGRWQIWLPELPDIQLVQNFHRIGMNTTYWKNWPTEPTIPTSIGLALAPDLPDHDVEPAAGMSGAGRARERPAGSHWRLQNSRGNVCKPSMSSSASACSC